MAANPGFPPAGGLPLLSEDDLLLDRSPSTSFIAPNPIVGGIAASLISSVINDSGANQEVNQHCSNPDQVELLHEMWPELAKWSPSSSRVSGLPSPVNFDSDLPFLSEGENWPSLISTSCVVQPDASQNSISDEQFSCPSADLLVFNDRASRPVLDAGLLRQLLLKRAHPNTSTLAPPPTNNEMKTTVPTASTPSTLPRTKRKRSASNGLDRFILGRPSKVRPAGQINRSDCSSHQDPPRRNITSTSPAPPVHGLKSTKVACESHRRKQMSGLLSTLRTLLPKEFPQKHRCLIIDEACDYIQSLEKRLQILKMKMHILDAILSQTSDYCSKSFQEDGSELSTQVQVSVLKEHDMIYITIGCLEKIPGLFCNILSILQQDGLDVTNANLSQSEVAVVYVFHVQVRKMKVSHM